MRRNLRVKDFRRKVHIDKRLVPRCDRSGVCVCLLTHLIPICDETTRECDDIGYVRVTYDMKVRIRCPCRNTHASIGDETGCFIFKDDNIGHSVSVIGHIFKSCHETCELTSITMELRRMNVRDDAETTCDGHGTGNSRKRLGRICHVDIPHNMKIGIWCAGRNTDPTIRDETRRRIFKDNHVGHGVSVIGDIFKSRDQTRELASVTMELRRMDVTHDTDTTCDGHSTCHGRERFGRICHVDVTDHM